MDERTERKEDFKRQFGDLLSLEHGSSKYDARLKALLTPEHVQADRIRLDVSVHDVMTFSQDLYRELLKAPEDCIPAFEDALDEYIRAQDIFAKVLKDGQKVRLGFSGEFGRNKVSPRQLDSEFLCALVDLEGIITKCSLVNPKLETSVHYCATTQRFSTNRYRDATSFDGLPTSTVYPSRDESGNTLVTEYGLCTYSNLQTVTVQELPETAPPGQLPRSAEVTLESDLVDSCKPGDRVSIVGVYKVLPPRAQGVITGVFNARLMANAVRHLSEERGTTEVTPAQEAALEKLAAEPDVIDQLAASLAPSIYGHDTIKKGLLLLLLGGRERQLENGTRLRGDVNCLLVGDPGVAKSQMLRAIMNIAPLAVSTTGKGSSGVGLTAAVTHDKDTGQRRLEAGAMVLADRGLVCIDEFDKMNDIDRVAIHEVMEQQTVTIAKAGCQMSLNARCSVLAAANPLYGSFDEQLSITRNINLPDSLLSRFDLLFVVTDNLTEFQDRTIAEHVLGQHRYRRFGDDGRSAPVDAEEGLEPTRDESLEAGAENVDPSSWMYSKYNTSLHGALAQGAKPPLSVDCIRKFVALARARSKNIALEEDAMESVGDFYTELRSEAKENALPVTVRTLETIIRLSTAVAKARLAEGVRKRDVEEAIQLIRDMLRGNLHKAPDEMDTDENLAPDQSPPRADASPGSEPSDEEADPEPSEPSRAERLPEISKRTRTDSAARSNDENDPGEAVQSAAPQPRATAGRQPLADATAAGPPSGVAAADLSAVKEALHSVFGTPAWRGSLALSDLMTFMRGRNVDISEEVVKKALTIMAAEYEEDMEANIPIQFDEAEGKIYEI